MQTEDGSFKKKNNPELFEDRFNEDTDALFFDANGDAFPDLLVTSGGGQVVGQFRELLDRLYLNPAMELLCIPKLFRRCMQTRR